MRNRGRGGRTPNEDSIPGETGKPCNDVSSTSDADATDGGETQHQSMCWICYEADSVENMVSPCACKGSMRWVHARCLLQWVTANTAEHSERLRCPQCREEYRFPATPAKHGNAALHAPEQEHPWPAGHLFPSRRRLAVLDPILAEDTTWRLRACLKVLLPLLLNLAGTLAVLLEFWRRYDDPSIGPGQPVTPREDWIDVWMSSFDSVFAHTETRKRTFGFTGPPGPTHVFSLWSSHFQFLQRVSTISVALAILGHLSGWYSWVDWEAGGHFLPAGRAQRVQRHARFVMCTNVPLARTTRLFIAEYLLRLLRPWPLWHGLCWRFAYDIFDSSIEVMLCSIQTVVLLVFWSRAAARERVRARRQVLSMWHLKRLGGIVTAEGAGNAGNAPAGAGVDNGAIEAQPDGE